jgi:hypothetical protein
MPATAATSTTPKKVQLVLKSGEIHDVIKIPANRSMPDVIIWGVFDRMKLFVKTRRLRRSRFYARSDAGSRATVKEREVMLDKAIRDKLKAETSTSHYYASFIDYVCNGPGAERASLYQLLKSRGGPYVPEAFKQKLADARTKYERTRHTE